jgi:hypothetical protein
MATTISFPTSTVDPQSRDAADAFADDSNNTLSLLQSGLDVSWGTFSGLSIPAGATIDGIEIIADVSSNSPGNNCDWKVYNGAWSSNKTPNTHTGKGQSVIDPYVGGGGDLWGLSWDATTAANIQIEVDLSTMTSGSIMFLDFLKVRITYTEASGYGNAVNGVASANIGKVDGVTTANIEKVIGV